MANEWTDSKGDWTGTEHRCVFYIDPSSSDRPLTVCGHLAQYMCKGSSYCTEHIELALRGKTWETLQEMTKRYYERTKEAP